MAVALQRSCSPMSQSVGRWKGRSGSHFKREKSSGGSQHLQGLFTVQNEVVNRFQAH